VARLGCEKENLEGEMVKERSAYQGLLETLKAQYHETAEKKNNILSTVWVVCFFLPSLMHPSMHTQCSYLLTG